MDVPIEDDDCIVGEFQPNVFSFKCKELELSHSISDSPIWI